MALPTSESLPVDNSGQNVELTSATAVPIQQSNRASARAKLPKLEVRKFKGSVFEWQEYWDAFESSIHNNEGLSVVHKFTYLKGLVEEPAKSAISGFALTVASYGSALELLKRRFGRPDMIQRATLTSC